MTATAFPLQWPDGWPRAKARTRSPYKVKPATALEELHSELRLLGAEHVVVSSNAPVRHDGRPYADALVDRFADPGVAAYFVLRKTQQVIACDAWGLPWENIRAIGLTVGAMRQIERTGASELLNRAFAGFKALAGPQHWREVLGIDPITASVGLTAQVVNDAYKALARRAHPDSGGSHDAMAALNVARDQALAEIEGGARG